MIVKPRTKNFKFFEKELILFFDKENETLKLKDQDISLIHKFNLPSNRFSYHLDYTRT